MDDDGVACISEYGLEVVLRDEAFLESTPINARSMAPEILSASGGRIPSGDGGKAVDVYSFAMVMFEVCPPRVHPSVYLGISSLTPGLDGCHPVFG